MEPPQGMSVRADQGCQPFLNPSYPRNPWFLGPKKKSKNKY